MKLLLVAPDVVQVAVSGGKTVDRIVRLAEGTDHTADSVGMEATSEAAILVNLANVDLDGRVVLGADET
ncbi:hypothetical protein H4217_006407, partial [Coemansia sp. RSA 1939]